MVEDRLGRMSQLGFESIKLSPGVWNVQPKRTKRLYRYSTHIAASIGGQAAMVEDRLGRMSQLGFKFSEEI